MTGEVCVIETAVDLLDVPVPAAAYYPADSLGGDASNHFGPNALCVHGWLAQAGFSRVVEFEPWSTNPHGGRADLRREGCDNSPHVLRGGSASGRLGAAAGWCSTPSSEPRAS